MARAKEKISDKERDKLKGKLRRMRRSRGGRTLPRSGAGVHDNRSKAQLIEDELAEEAEREMKEYVDRVDYMEDEEDEYYEGDY